MSGSRGEGGNIKVAGGAISNFIVPHGRNGCRRPNVFDNKLQIEGLIGKGCTAGDDVVSREIGIRGCAGVDRVCSGERRKRTACDWVIITATRAAGRGANSSLHFI